MSLSGAQGFFRFDNGLVFNEPVTSMRLPGLAAERE